MHAPENTAEHFSHDELKCHVAGSSGIDCPRCGGANLVTRELIGALNDLRSAVGRPIAIDSAYRCPWHNAAVGGAKNSEHVRGTAADIRIAGMTAREMYRAANAVPAFRAGGIGVAVHQNYIHVDVRAHTARWCYDAAGKTIPWYPELNPVEVLA